MKSSSDYCVFTGKVASLNMAALCEMIYDLFEEDGLDITYLRWNPEKKQFDISFETADES